MKLKFKKNDWKSRFVAKPFYTFIYVQYITSKRQGAYKLMKSDIIVIIMLYKKILGTHNEKSLFKLSFFIECEWNKASNHGDLPIFFT